MSLIILFFNLLFFVTRIYGCVKPDLSLTNILIRNYWNRNNLYYKRHMKYLISAFLLQNNKVQNKITNDHETTAVVRALLVSLHWAKCTPFTVIFLFYFVVKMFLIYLWYLILVSKWYCYNRHCKNAKPSTQREINIPFFCKNERMYGKFENSAH